MEGDSIVKRSREGVGIIRKIKILAHERKKL